MTIHIIDTGDRPDIGLPRRARALTPIERVRDFFFDPLPVRRAATSLWATAWQMALQSKEIAS